VATQVNEGINDDEDTNTHTQKKKGPIDRYELKNAGFFHFQKVFDCRSFCRETSVCSPQGMTTCGRDGLAFNSRPKPRRAEDGIGLTQQQTKHVISSSALQHHHLLLLLISF
jgi:hypothetical protein